MSQMRLQFIFLEKKLQGEIANLYPEASLSFIESQNTFEEALDRFDEEAFDAVICGSSAGFEAAIEAGQLIRQLCGSTPLLFVSTDTAHFKPKDLLKNGYSHTFFLPMDKSLFHEEIHSIQIQLGKQERVYKPVYVVDLEPESELEFSTYVYLPLNKKHICFSRAKSKITKDRIEKLETNEMGQLLIDKKDMDSFLKYSSERLTRLGNNSDGLSETERKEKLQSSVRGLFSSLIDSSEASNFDTGKEMLANCQKIISLYLTKGKEDNWHSQLIRAIRGANNSYDHAASVSTLASLFAIAIDHPHPEDLAMAAFLHDLGRTRFTDEMMLTPLEEWSEEEREAYMRHPVESLNIIKTKKMIMPEAVEKAIAQHHEKFNGRGFPRQLAGDRICIEAQILSFADQVFYLTMELEGKRRLSPYEAFQEIKMNGSIGPALIRQLSPLFTPPVEKTLSKTA